MGRLHADATGQCMHISCAGEHGRKSLCCNGSMASRRCTAARCAACEQRRPAPSIVRHVDVEDVQRLRHEPRSRLNISTTQMLSIPAFRLDGSRGPDLVHEAGDTAEVAVDRPGEMMDIRNRLPMDFRTGPSRGDAGLPADVDAAVIRELMADGHTRDAVAALLHLLTRLANCGLDAGAPPLLRSARSEV